MLRNILDTRMTMTHNAMHTTKRTDKTTRTLIIRSFSSKLLFPVLGPVVDVADDTISWM
jgi:hypothetical protein